MLCFPVLFQARRIDALHRSSNNNSNNNSSNNNNINNTQIAAIVDHAPTIKGRTAYI